MSEKYQGRSLKGDNYLCGMNGVLCVILL